MEGNLDAFNEGGGGIGRKKQEKGGRGEWREREKITHN